MPNYCISLESKTSSMVDVTIVGRCPESIRCSTRRLELGISSTGINSSAPQQKISILLLTRSRKYSSHLRNTGLTRSTRSMTRPCPLITRATPLHEAQKPKAKGLSYLSASRQCERFLYSSQSSQVTRCWYHRRRAESQTTPSR